MSNIQILTPDENMRKGAKEFKPYEWQHRFREAFERRETTDFLLVAAPGSGKTLASLWLASEWMRRGQHRRLIVVVPSQALKEQWREEAHESFRMNLQSRKFGNFLKPGFVGAVVTYQGIVNMEEFCQGVCGTDTMVIFDEVHHCGDEAAWGKAIVAATGKAKSRLLMSGTPWRPDDPIPFARYNSEGYAVADFSYTLSEALADKVVREVVFDHAKGSVTNDLTGETTFISDTTSDDESARVLNQLLDPKGDYLRQMIRDADRRLTECRFRTPKAAAMAACIDRAHAQQVAEVIRQETGCKPHIIVDDVEMATTSIEAFRNSDDRWLVSVRQVSEGTDIKRLMVLCYLTNVTTPLFFRQVVGRVQRRTGDDEEAHVFLPADRRLMECAKTMEQEHVCAYERTIERDEQELERMQSEAMLFESYSTTHHGSELVLIGSEQVPADQYATIQMAADQMKTTMAQAWGFFQLWGRGGATQDAGIELEPETKSLEQRLEEAAKKNSELARKIVRLEGKSNDRDAYKQVHIRHGNGKRSEDMSLAEQLDKQASMLAEIRKLVDR